MALIEFQNYSFLFIHHKQDNIIQVVTHTRENSVDVASDLSTYGKKQKAMIYLSVCL